LFLVATTAAGDDDIPSPKKLFGKKTTAAQETPGQTTPAVQTAKVQTKTQVQPERIRTVAGASHSAAPIKRKPSEDDEPPGNYDIDVPPKPSNYTKFMDCYKSAIQLSAKYSRNGEHSPRVFSENRIGSFQGFDSLGVLDQSPKMLPIHLAADGKNGPRILVINRFGAYFYPAGPSDGKPSESSPDRNKWFFVSIPDRVDSEGETWNTNVLLYLESGYTSHPARQAPVTYPERITYYPGVYGNMEANPDRAKKPGEPGVPVNNDDFVQKKAAEQMQATWDDWLSKLQEWFTKGEKNPQGGMVSFAKGDRDYYISVLEADLKDTLKACKASPWIADSEARFEKQVASQGWFKNISAAAAGGGTKPKPSAAKTG
jgi:hypothetical protein